VDRELDALRARAMAIPLDASAREAWAARMNRMPAMQVIGATLDLGDPQLVALRLPTVAEHHVGGLGTRAVNGAIIAGLFDGALGVAGVLQFVGRRAGTVELSIKLMRPAFEAPLEAYGLCVKRTPHLAFTEAELYSDGRLCAAATGIVAVASQPKDGEADYW
jgi:acyl-coenzyme A thioesterase PaaI-like protein